MLPLRMGLTRVADDGRDALSLQGGAAIVAQSFALWLAPSMLHGLGIVRLSIYVFRSCRGRGAPAAAESENRTARP